MNSDFIYDFEHWRERKIDGLVFIIIVFLLISFFKKIIKFDDKTAITLGLSIGSVLYFHCLFAWRLNFGKMIIDLFSKIVNLVS